MVKKIIGYILSGVGLLGIALTFPQIATITKIALPFDTLTLTIGSVIVLGAGILILSRNKGTSKQKSQEVPIYKGKEIVGYRRT